MPLLNSRLGTLQFMAGASSSLTHKLILQLYFYQSTSRLSVMHRDYHHVDYYHSYLLKAMLSQPFPPQL